jgi:signal transduction histidine kinase
MFQLQRSETSPISSRYKITKIQTLLALSALIALVALGISSISEFRAADQRSRILSDIETPAASIIFTQRETLVYATKLALWSNGGTPRRNVQIARNLLAQRLSVIDASGRTMGSRADEGYWSALRKSDEIVSAAPAGILPEEMHREMNPELLPVIDEILAQARNLVVSYQRSIDQEMVDLAKETAERDSLNLTLFYIVFISAGLFLTLNTRGNFKNYRIARSEITRERERLEATIKELEAVQNRVTQLEDLDSAKNALISTVNHELRTPLTSIIGYIDLLQRDADTLSQEEKVIYLEVLERNSHVLLNLVESMLSLSKFDNAEGKLSADPVDLHAVIDDALFTMKPAMDKAEIKTQLSAAIRPIVNGDVGQLSQVFINLIANSVKFSPRGSAISISLSVQRAIDGDEVAEVVIADSGIGIPQDDIPRIFTRFFRAKNVDSGKYQGTGLGLSIVERAIAHHGGSISVESTLHQGTSFTITLPLASKEENNVEQ